MLGRIFGAGLGWTFAGPIGALIGWWLGGRIDNEQLGNPLQMGSTQSRTRPGDFAIAVLVLVAAVMKADGKVLKSELDYVKRFLVKSFGQDNAREMLVLLRNLLEQDYFIYEVADQINRQMRLPEKLQLMHVLLGISQADGHVHDAEIEIIWEIGKHLKLSQADIDSILAIVGRKDSKAYYQILEIDPSASDQEVKKAYRRMATRFHPDKVQHLGDDFKGMAEEKFKAINEAYHEIKRERKM